MTRRVNQVLRGQWRQRLERTARQRAVDCGLLPEGILSIRFSEVMLKAGFSTAAETDSSVWSSDAVLA